MERVAIDFVVAALIGAVIFVIVGYFAQAGGMSFSRWLALPQPGPWATVGALVGTGLRYLRR
jgi:hypothetical protein